MELRMLEKNEGSMAEVWKSKCKELVDICNKLKSENEILRFNFSSMSQQLQESAQQQNNQDQQRFFGDV